MKPEYRDALKARLDEAVEKKSALLMHFTDSPLKVELHWSKDGVEIVSGDGVDVRISLAVLARIIGEFDRISLGVLQGVEEPCVWSAKEEAEVLP